MDEQHARTYESSRLGDGPNPRCWDSCFLSCSALRSLTLSAVKHLNLCSKHGRVEYKRNTTTPYFLPSFPLHSDLDGILFEQLQRVLEVWDLPEEFVGVLDRLERMFLGFGFPKVTNGNLIDDDQAGDESRNFEFVTPVF